eukprot:355846-Chlamydomonas_euryale.AAC.7
MADRCRARCAPARPVGRRARHGGRRRRVLERATTPCARARRWGLTAGAANRQAEARARGARPIRKLELLSPVGFARQIDPHTLHTGRRPARQRLPPRRRSAAALTQLCHSAGQLAYKEIETWNSVLVWEAHFDV